MELIKEMIGVRPESNVKNFEAFAHKRTESVLAGQSEYPLGPFPRQGRWGDHPGEKLSGEVADPIGCPTGACLGFKVLLSRRTGVTV